MLGVRVFLTLPEIIQNQSLLACGVVIPSMTDCFTETQSEKEPLEATLIPYQHYSWIG